MFLGPLLQLTPSIAIHFSARDGLASEGLERKGRVAARHGEELFGDQLGNPNRKARLSGRDTHSLLSRYSPRRGGRTWVPPWIRKGTGIEEGHSSYFPFGCVSTSCLLCYPGLRLSDYQRL